MTPRRISLDEYRKRYGKPPAVSIYRKGAILLAGGLVGSGVLITVVSLAIPIEHSETAIKLITIGLVLACVGLIIATMFGRKPSTNQPKGDQQ